MLKISLYMYNINNKVIFSLQFKFEFLNFIQDPKASRDLNDKNDKKNDPMPNVNKAGNRSAGFLLYGT